VRSGTLREHLACGLLTLARVGRADAVLDPFMGTGTILRSAAERFDVRVCIGAEVDAAAYRDARRMIQADGRLRHGSFEELDFDTLPHSVKLVSNLPFGVQFTQVPTRRLLAFLVSLQPRLRAVALLMSREQARVVAEALPLRTKHVLVLGQPAAIVYSWDREEPGRRSPDLRFAPSAPAHRASRPLPRNRLRSSGRARRD
jgi:23S rRNA G2445 N2-methylase RlmL